MAGLIHPCGTPKGIKWGSIEKISGGKYRGSNVYEYNTVQFTEKNGDLYVRFSGTSKANPVKQRFSVVENYANTTANEVINYILQTVGYANPYPWGRHFDDGLMKYYKEHDVRLGFIV